MRSTTLSDAAKKHLLGDFPIRQYDLAVQELVDAGFVFCMSMMWFQTEAGLKERFRLEYPWYGQQS